MMNDELLLLAGTPHYPTIISTGDNMDYRIFHMKGKSYLKV